MHNNTCICTVKHITSSASSVKRSSCSRGWFVTSCKAELLQPTEHEDGPGMNRIILEQKSKIWELLGEVWWLSYLCKRQSRLNDIVCIRVLQQLFKARNWEKFMDDSWPAIYKMFKAFFNHMTAKFMHWELYKVPFEWINQFGCDRRDL